MIAFLLWAVEETEKPQEPGFFAMYFPFIMLGLLLLFWLMVLRPSMRRQEQERQAMINTLEKNDQVITIAGIYATVVSVNEKEDEMIVRLEDDQKVKMTRSCVARNLTKEEKLKETQQAAAGNKDSK